MNYDNAYPRTREERNKFIENNMDLLHFVAHLFPYCGLEYEDLFQEVCEGAIKALNTFDPDRGAKLSTYIVECSKNHVKMIIRERNTQRRTAILVSLEQNMSNSKEDKETSLLNQDNSSVDSLHSPAPELSDTMHHRQLISAVEKAMCECLSESQRIAIKMEADGYSQKEIGKKLSMSQGNISKLLRLAHCELRLYLQAQGITAEHVEY